MNKFYTWIKAVYNIDYNPEIAEYQIKGVVLNERVMVGPMLQYIEITEKEFNIGNLVEILTVDYPLEVLGEIICG